MMWECDMLSQYNKYIESWRDNAMENTSTELSLAENSAMVKEKLDQQPVVIFTKDNMDAYKPVRVVFIPPEMFIGGPTRQGRT